MLFSLLGKTYQSEEIEQHLSQLDNQRFNLRSPNTSSSQYNKTIPKSVYSKETNATVMHEKIQLILMQNEKFPHHNRYDIQRAIERPNGQNNGQAKTYLQCISTTPNKVFFTNNASFGHFQKVSTNSVKNCTF